MEAQSIVDFFTGILNDPNLLKNAFNLINNKINADVEFIKNSHPVQQTFIAKTIQYLSNQPETQNQNSHQTYFHIITIFHSPLISNFLNLSESIQDTIRSGLLNAILAHQSSLKCMAALGLFIRQLIEIDSTNGGFNEWLQPLAQLLKWLNSQDPVVIEAGVEFFIFLLKQTPYNQPNSQLPLHKVSGQMLSVLFGLFTGTQEEASVLRQKILFLVFQIVKTFSIFDGVEDSVVSSCFDGTFELWMSLFSSIIKSSLTSHLGLKKYVLKILVIIYRDMNIYSGKRFKSENSSKQLIAVWEFLYRFLPVYLQYEVWGKSLQQFSNHYYDDDSEAILNNIEALVHNIVQFISVLVCSPSLSLTVRLSVYHLTNSLFHYYMVSLWESKNWDCNIHYFINTPDHEGLRCKVLNVLNQLIQKYNDQAIQAILVIAEKFLMNYSQSHTMNVVKTIFQSMDIKKVLESKKLQISLSTDNLLKLSELSGCDIKEQLKLQGQSWRKSEVALSILGRFSQDIIVFQSKQTGIFDIESFVKGLMRQFSLEDNSKFSSLLKGQSLYCLTRFTQIISIKYKQLFTDLITSCSICVSELFPNAVRVAACKILAIYFRKLQKHKIKLSENHIQNILHNHTTENIMTIQITNETNNFALEALIQIVRYEGLGPKSLPTQFSSGYLLNNFHSNISHQSVLKLSFTLLQHICQNKESYKRIIFAKDQKYSSPLIMHFIFQCLQAYVNVVTSQQKLYLKTLDTDLIVMVLKLTNMVAENCPSDKPQLGKQIIQFLPLLTAIIQNNEDVQVHVSTTICLKNMVRKSSSLIKQAGMENKVVQSIHSLLNIPSDKSFQAASIYVGNLTILTFDKLLQKPDQQILKQVVLKVFRSRTPSVIQSLVLIYARLINMSTDIKNPFAFGQWMQKLNNIVDFLASFSIQNRMGLKILTDKWLLQQSLFRGKYTKISTFMALSKLFLLRDKRVDNLLVIGFNPSHTNINNDVNAPLKILATLIRCLNNQMGGKAEEAEDSGQDQFTLRQQSDSNTLEVQLQKFKQRQQKKEDEGNINSGGLADRQNQQGSTCYMSAMLQFYDDGQQCDQTTQEDLIDLKDCSTQFQLAEYLTDFFLNLNEPNSPNHSYFKQCLKDLLKQDVRNLQKHIKITL